MYIRDKINCIIKRRQNPHVGHSNSEPHNVSMAKIHFFIVLFALWPLSFGSFVEKSPGIFSLIPTEKSDDPEASSFATTIDTNTKTTLHFKHVSHITTITESAFVSFTVDIKPLVSQHLKLVLALNNSVEAVHANVLLSPFKEEVEYLAHEAALSYNLLKGTLAPWESEHTFENSADGRTILGLKDSATHKMKTPENVIYPASQSSKPTTKPKAKAKKGRHTRATAPPKTKPTTSFYESHYRDIRAQASKSGPKLEDMMTLGGIGEPNLEDMMTLGDFDFANNVTNPFDPWETAFRSGTQPILISRQPRQLAVAAAGAALFAGGSWLASKLHLSTLLGLNDGTSEYLQVQLGKLQKYTKIEGKHIERMNKSIKAMLKIETDIVGRNDFYVHYNQLSEHFESLRLKVHELNRGLSELLHSKITPDLIEYYKLRQGFERIVLEAKAAQMIPVTKDAAELYSLPASHVFNGEDLTFFIAIGIPLADPMAKMELYHYIPFPTFVRIREDSYYIIAKPEKQFLGVNTVTKTYYELDAGSLALCQKLHEIYLCPPTGIQVGGEESCIVALFKGDAQKIFKVCEHSLASKNYIIQKDAHQFQMYVHDDQLVKVTCDFSEQESSKKFNGIFNVFLPYGCSAEIKNFKVSSKTPIFGKTIKIKISDLPYGEEAPDTFKEKIKHIERETNKTFNADENQIKDILVNLDLGEERTFHLSIGLIITSFLCFLLLCSCCIIYCRRTIKKKLRKQMEARNQGGINLTINNQQENEEPPIELRQHRGRLYQNLLGGNPPGYESDNETVSTNPSSQAAYYKGPSNLSSQLSQATPTASGQGPSNAPPL